jgi:hypothetical protein
MYMSLRIYFLLVTPHHGDASAHVRVDTGYILYPAYQKNRIEALFAGHIFPTETVRVFWGRVERCKMNKECSSTYSK